MLSVSGRQTPLPQDERGELLRAVHGGAGHPARPASVRDGHRRVCQPTQKVDEIFIYIIYIYIHTYISWLIEHC